MNLLFDQNISYRITKKLAETFPGCRHLSSVQLMNASDEDIWTFANTNNFCIVTFDSDFLNLATLRGTPPKIILLKIRNTGTQQLASLLESHAQTINIFITDSAYREIACLEITEALGTT